MIRKIFFLILAFLLPTLTFAGQGMGPGPGNKTYASCTPTETPESSCSDGLDNDCDGYIDGVDSDCVGGGSFVGTPGTTETFEAPGITLSEITETDASGYITPGSSTAAHGGTYSAEFANTTTAAARTHYIRADIGAVDDGFTLSWWWKTPNNGTIYNDAVIFKSSANTDLTQSTDLNGEVLWDGNGTTGKLKFSITGTAGQVPSTNTLTYNSWYRFQFNFTNSTQYTLGIYNSSNTLVETLTISTTKDKPVRYFYWFDDTGVGENTYLDDIQYDSTNP